MPIAVGTELTPCLRPPPTPAINAVISSPQTCPISTSAGGAAISITLARPMSTPDVVMKPTSSSQSCPVPSPDAIKDPVNLPRESEQVTSPWFFLPDNKLSIVHLNIEGLLGQARRKNGAGPTDTLRKIDFLRYSVQFKNSPNLLCLTETKLGKCIDDGEISLHGYTVYRRDRDQ